MQIRLNWDQVLANIAAFHQEAHAVGRRVRPHVKGHRSSAVTAAQVARGSTGIVAQTLEEAVYHASSTALRDVVIARPTTETWRLARYVCQKHRVEDLGTRVIVQVGDLDHVSDLIHLTARDRGSLAVRLELEGGAGRGLHRDALIRAAHLVTEAPGLSLDGVTTYWFPESQEQVDRWPDLVRVHAGRLTDVATTIRAERVACPVVSFGGTVNASHLTGVSDIDEVTAGVYAFSDADTADRAGLTPALRLRATEGELVEACRDGGILSDCAHEWAPATPYRRSPGASALWVDVVPSHLCPLMTRDIEITVEGRGDLPVLRPELHPDRP